MLAAVEAAGSLKSGGPANRVSVLACDQDRHATDVGKRPFVDDGVWSYGGEKVESGTSGSNGCCIHPCKSQSAMTVGDVFSCTFCHGVWLINAV